MKRKIVFSNLILIKLIIFTHYCVSVGTHRLSRFKFKDEDANNIQSSACKRNYRGLH